MPPRKTLVLIDGHAVAYRAFFALNVEHFTNQQGEPTNATYGFTRKLVEVLEETPDYIAVAFDRGLSGRETLYEDYKGTREAMPDDLRSQMDRIEEMVQAFNVPILTLDGFEADDVIGTVAKQAEEQGCDVRVVTGDRDLLQLLSEHTVIQLPVRGKPDKVWDRAAFLKKYDDFPPERFVELKGLMGDSSDNIPGVKGIGEKGGITLLTEFESIEAIYESLEAVGNRYKKHLDGNRELAILSRDLSAIQRDLPIELVLDACVATDFDPKDVYGLFDELNFGDTLRQRIGGMIQKYGSKEAQEKLAAVELAEEFAPDFTIVRNEDDLVALAEKLKGAKLIAFDTETTGIDKMQVKLVGISLAVEAEHGYYIPVGHINPNEQPSLFDQDNQTPQQLPLETVIEALRGPMQDPAIPKAAHNAEYDVVMLRRYGIDPQPIAEDTMIAEWVANPGSNNLGLKALAKQRLGIKMKNIEELIGKGAKQITMDRVPVDAAADYAAADAIATFQLVKPLQDALKSDDMPRALSLYQTLELPLIPIIADMEMAGIKLDRDYLAQMSTELHGRQDAIEAEIFELGGGEFNVNSGQQLNKVLFETLNLPTQGLKKTKSGDFSLTAGVLEELHERVEHPILEKILAYRSLQKLLSTYIDALPELINPHTGRVHTSFNQTGAVTGRFSSSNPNLQNIPIRTEEGRQVRGAFIAEDGMTLLSVDYSQIELRILAHYSYDASLRQAFLEGQDIHTATAAKVNKIAPADVTPDQRRLAKAINFGLMYGMGAYRLTRETDLYLGEAEAFIKNYFDNFPGVRDYLDATKKFAEENGYVETLFGRRRAFPELMVSGGNQQVRQRAEREAINMPIQGTAADILKKAMIDIHPQLPALDAKMLLQVHDELVFEVPEGQVDAVREMVVQTMQAAGDVLDVPVVADAKVGHNWADMA